MSIGSNVTAPFSSIASADMHLEGISLSRKNRTLLANLSITVPAATTLAVMGRSGAGKTTLLRTISGLSAPDAGQISGISGCVPVVFQEPRLLPWRTVRQNVELILPEAHRSSGMEWLARVGLADVADAYPLTLSGGMRQRVSIARALARESTLVLVDEPFSHLDVVTANQLRNELKLHLAETGRACIWVTHDPAEAAQVADRTLVMAGPPSGAWHVVNHHRYPDSTQLAAALAEAIERSGFNSSYMEVS